MCVFFGQVPFFLGGEDTATKEFWNKVLKITCMIMNTGNGTLHWIPLSCFMSLSNNGGALPLKNGKRFSKQ